MGRLKVGVLISGTGTNLQALLDAAADPAYPAEIALVVANKTGAGGLARAEAAGVATRVVEHRAFADRESFEQMIDGVLRAAGCELVCLAGFMRILTPGFVEGWRDRLVNIHPSLLPAFRGLDAQGQALAAGVRIAGCTVHFVRPEMDSGPIIVQGAVPVMDGDTPASLSARILKVEHRIYPLAVGLIGAGRVRVDGDRVSIDSLDVSPADDRILLSPTLALPG